VSFDPHPDVVLSQSFQPSPPLTPHAERRALLTTMGVEIYEVVPFTRELAALDPEDFVERYLIQPFGMRDLVVGSNFALGQGRAGDAGRLREIGAARGFEVEVVPLLEVDGAPVSSTRIRGLLAEGRVAEAARLLGRRYGLTGAVVEGDGIGRTLGCPTANLRLHQEKLLPADGIYAAWARIGGDRAWRPAAMSIGMRPTFGEQARALEVHLLHWNGELLRRELEVELQAWIRAQLKFDSTEALAAAMQADLQAARTRLDAATAPA
jgi:riboflavin kinase/FMN adenylyltransferase